MVIEIFKNLARYPAKLIMISKNDKIRMLNSLLAAISPISNEIFANATAGINKALKDGTKVSLEEFAHRAIAIYNPSAKLEFIDFSSGYFDPLFAIVIISSAMKRLSGYPSAILVINGLSELPQGKRRTKNMRQQKAEDLEMAESYVMRYRKSFPSIEVFFI